MMSERKPKYLTPEESVTLGELKKSSKENRKLVGNALWAFSLSVCRFRKEGNRCTGLCFPVFLWTIQFYFVMIIPFMYGDCFIPGGLPWFIQHFLFCTEYRTQDHWAYRAYVLLLSYPRQSKYIRVEEDWASPLLQMQWIASQTVGRGWRCLRPASTIFQHKRKSKA